MESPLRSRFRLRSSLGRRLVAEFTATALLMYMGFCVNSQTVLSRGELNGSLGTIVGWGFSLVFAVQMAFHTSGAHLNPAISFSLWSFGNLPTLDFVLYSAVQTAACFFGAALSFVHYYDKLNEFDGGNRRVFGENATAQIYATYPGEHLSLVSGVFDQLACTAVLALIVGVIVDERNKIPKVAQPPLFGVMLIAISLGFGLNAGNAMNPARDFGPRLFTLLVYGPEVFTCWSGLWFLIPLICPFFGAVGGSWAYQLLVGFQMPDENAPSSLPSSASSAADLIADRPKLQIHALV